MRRGSSHTSQSSGQGVGSRCPPSWWISTPSCWPIYMCRLPSPKALLGRLGGPLAYSWLEQFTPLEAWLGGYEQEGKPVRSAAVLSEFLRAKGFELLREADEPLVIREHARKYQYIVTHAMLWRRVK